MSLQFRTCLWLLVESNDVHWPQLLSAHHFVDLPPCCSFLNRKFAFVQKKKCWDTFPLVLSRRLMIGDNQAKENTYEKRYLCEPMKCLDDPQHCNMPTVFPPNTMPKSHMPSVVIAESSLLRSLERIVNDVPAQSTHYSANFFIQLFSERMTLGELSAKLTVHSVPKIGIHQLLTRLINWELAQHLLGSCRSHGLHI